MNEATDIVVEPFNDHYVIVYGNKKKFDDEMKSRSGTWYDKLNGWLISKKQKSEIEVLANVIKNKSILEYTSNNFAKKTSKQKFHRSVSDDESSSPESFTLKRETRKFSRSPKKVKAKEKEKEKEKERSFIPIETLLDMSSSDSEHESSDDSDFPEASLPRDHEKEFKEFLRKQRKIKNKK